MKNALFMAAALLAMPAASLAQNAATDGAATNGAAAARPASVFDRDNVTIGAGGVYAPRYEGSSDYRLRAGPVLRGSIAGFNFVTPGPGLQVDLVRDGKDRKTDIKFGPLVRLNFNRTDAKAIDDVAVRQLGEIDMGVEVGGFAGIGQAGVLNPYDNLGAQVSVRKDVAGASDGLVVTPSLSYMTPLSKAVVALASVSANHADGKYMRTYFGVTPAGAVRSGLAAYTPKAGWKDVNASLGAMVDLSGDLTDGGFGVGLFGNYSRILGDAADSPIVKDRGSRDQWVGAFGVVYTF